MYAVQLLTSCAAVGKSPLHLNKPWNALRMSVLVMLSCVVIVWNGAAAQYSQFLGISQTMLNSAKWQLKRNTFDETSQTQFFFDGKMNSNLFDTNHDQKQRNTSYERVPRIRVISLSRTLFRRSSSVKLVTVNSLSITILNNKLRKR